MKTGKTQWDRLLLDARAMTLAGDRGYGLIEDAAIGIAGHQIVFAGRRADLPFAPDEMAERVELFGGALVTPGLIDADYRGELKVLLVNTDPAEPFLIERGERIAQLVIQAVEHVAFVEVDELDDTERGDGGFGHTGR